VAAFDKLRKRLELQGGEATRPGLAVAYHHLGMVAQNRGDLAAAEDWYRKSVSIREEPLGRGRRAHGNPS
jgi:hypothetical protein